MKKFTDEHRANLSKALTGRKLSDQQRAKISEGIKNAVRTPESLARYKTDEHRAKLSAALTGRTFSAETKQKMSDAKIGKPKPKVVCSFCSREISVNNIKKHMELCDMNPKNLKTDDNEEIR